MAMANRELNTAEIAYAAIGEVGKKERGSFAVFFSPFYISSAIHLLATQGAKHQIHKGAAIQGVAFSSPAVVQRSDSGG